MQTHGTGSGSRRRCSLHGNVIGPPQRKMAPLAQGHFTVRPAVTGSRTTFEFEKSYQWQTRLRFTITRPLGVVISVRSVRQRSRE